MKCNSDLRRNEPSKIRKFIEKCKLPTDVRTMQKRGDRITANNLKHSKSQSL